MLNSYYHKTESNVVAVTKEIEKTITPDKVTEMYDKVRAQAERDVITSLRVESNSLNGVVVQIADNYSEATSRVHTRFILNGKEHTGVETINSRELMTAAELWNKLADHYRETVAMTGFRDGSEVLSPGFRLLR